MRAQQGRATHPSGMRHADFRVGMRFFTATGEWLCTDVGSRTAVAIKVAGADPRDLSGPPYDVAEDVFDEYDFGGCSIWPFA